MSTTSTSTSPASPPTSTDAGLKRRTHELFDATLDASRARRHELLDEVVRLHMRVADSVAARYANRGIPVEDLRQVAYLALVRAADRFEATRKGAEFLSYAVPSMRGEVRKHFRDHGWMIRPTRRVQEMQGRIQSIAGDLTNALGRAPTSTELADRLDAPEGEIVEAQAADGCFRPSSLDHPVTAAGDEDPGSTLGDLLGDEDPALGAAEARVALGPAVARLDDRDRRILQLRFVEDLTQREIADDLGVTQMQISRLLARILGDLRTQLEGPGGAAA